MTNFDIFTATPQFESFASVAISAEHILHIDPSACVLNCRRAMEFAVKWMYSVDKALVMPYQDTLVSLMNAEDFRDIVGTDIWRRMDFIRRMGNNAAHSGKKVTEEQAGLCLENLYIFLDFVAYCYGENYTAGHFDRALLEQPAEAPAAQPDEEKDIDLAALMAENAALKEELTARRAEQQQTYVPKPLDLSEYKTRKLYIDTMLADAGWTEGKDWQNEVELPGMPNKSEVGYADYVLYGDDSRPLAVVEAKRTCVDVAKGRQQAKLYADLLEKKYHRRPVIFLTNGFETRITDTIYPERKCAAIYSKRDLEKLFNLQSMRTSLRNVMVDRSIAGRYYQEGAIKATCDAFTRNRRKALLVMATGSGKTRTVIALCDVLLQHGWVKNILFLADRNSLVTQAKRSFVNLLPDLSVTNLCEEKDNYTAHCVFSTYQTMYNVIDSVQDENGKLFTCGHFDLVICDEAHTITRTVVQGVHFDTRRRETAAGGSGPAGSAATAFLLVIPEKHAAFGRDYTLEPHDRVLAGTGPEVSYTQWLDFTPAKVPGLAAVQYVDCKTAAGQAAHVEAGGWWTRSGSGAHSLSN